MSNSSAKKYQRAKTQLAQSVLTVSLAVQETGMSKETATEMLVNAAKMVMRKHGLAYLVDAGAALLFRLDELGFMDMNTPKGKVRVRLFYEPLAEFMAGLCPGRIMVRPEMVPEPEVVNDTVE